MKKFMPAVLLICILLLSPVGKTQSKWFFIPHTAFIPEDEYVNWSVYSNYLIIDNSYDYMYAPVYLPQNSIIESMHLIYYDHGDGYVQASLYKQDPWAGTRNELLRVQSTGSELKSTRFDGSGVLVSGWRWVDNSTRAYYVRVNVNFGAAFYYDYNIQGVRIQYH
jgi:hypothetical protein